MRLQALLYEAPPSEPVVESIDELLERKANTRELGDGVVPDPLRQFIQGVLFDPRWDGAGQRRRPLADAQGDAAAVFRSLLEPFPR